MKRFGAILCLGFILATLVPSSQAQDTSIYTVKPGDTLFSIARAHDISVQDLRIWNDLEGAVLRAGVVLRVKEPVSESTGEESDLQNPGVDSTSVAPADSLENVTTPISSGSSLPIGTVTQLENGLVSVVIGAGETLYSLAQQFSIHPDTLITLNPHFGNMLHEGEQVIIPADRTITYYVVKRGDTLFGISSSTGASVSAIREINDMSGSGIRIGQRLRIPSAVVGKTGGDLGVDGELYAVVYPELLSGRMLSGGRRYDPQAFVVGHPELEAGSVLLLTNQDGSRETFALVSDRSLSIDPPILNVSDAVARALGISEAGEKILIHVVH